MSPEKAMERGFAFYNLQEYQKAAPLLGRAYEAGLDDPELVVRLAYCRAQLSGDPASAIDMLGENALRHPDYARTYHILGVLALQHSRTDNHENIRQAIGFCRRAAILDTTDWKIFDNLGMYFLMLDELDSALTWLEKAHQLNQDHEELNRRLAETKKMLARKARADSMGAADSLNRIKT